ncbi:hypothetical protein, partial [Stenotrophomonas sp. P5_B8]
VATVVPQKKPAAAVLHVDADLRLPLAPNMRDARTVGHWGSADLKRLMAQAYEGREVSGIG